MLEDFYPHKDNIIILDRDWFAKNDILKMQTFLGTKHKIRILELESSNENKHKYRFVNIYSTNKTIKISAGSEIWLKQ